MSPEKQRIKIAEFCGWKLKWQNMGGGPLFDVKPKKFSWPVWIPPQDYWSSPAGKRYLNEPDGKKEAPDYLNDLNEIHKAENTLTDYEYDEFLEILEFITYSEGQTSSQQRRKKSSATAAQRSEAFLKIRDLWED